MCEPEIDRPDFWGCNSTEYSLETHDWDLDATSLENWNGDDSLTLDGIPLWESNPR